MFMHYAYLICTMFFNGFADTKYDYRELVGPLERTKRYQKLSINIPLTIICCMLHKPSKCCVILVKGIFRELDKRGPSGPLLLTAWFDRPKALQLPEVGQGTSSLIPVNLTLRRRRTKDNWYSRSLIVFGIYISLCRVLETLCNALYKYT
jgi:hypothetical protein